MREDSSSQVSGWQRPIGLQIILSLSSIGMLYLDQEARHLQLIMIHTVLPLCSPCIGHTDIHSYIHTHTSAHMHTSGKTSPGANPAPSTQRSIV